MAWPVGVITRPITFSDVVDLEDGSVDVSRTRAIVTSNDPLLHVPSSVHVLPTPQIFTAAFTLPVTDQNGIWGDGQGNYFYADEGWNTHSYRVDLEYKDDAGTWISTRTIENLLVDDYPGNLDLDAVFESEGTVYDDARS